MKILLVDDSAPVLRGLERMIHAIEPEGFTVRMALNTFEALKVMEEFEPDLFIVDILMPGMDGLEFIEYLREHGSRAKIMLLTAYAEFGYAQQAIRLGVSDYLVKPIDQSRFKSLLLALEDNLRLEQRERKAVSAETLSLHDLFAIDRGAFPPVLRLILRHIEAHYDEDISLTSLASVYDISENYICALFSRHLNASFLRCLDQIRLQHAAYSLLNTNRSIDEIALETGFKYGTQLLRVFKKRIGATPTAWKARATGSHSHKEIEDKS